MVKPDRGASGARTRGRSATVEFDLDRATWIVVGIALFVAAIQVLTGYLRFTGYQSRFMVLLGFFDTNGQLTFNAWFGSIVIAAAGAGAAAASVRLEGAERRGFIALALILFYLSLDKATALTEFISDEMPKYIDVDDVKWTVIGLALLLAAGVLLAWWVWRLPGPTRSGLVLSGAVFLFGAVVLNSVSGLFNGDGSWAPTPVSVLEELAEIVGMVMLTRTCFLVARGGGEELSLRDVFGLS